MIASNVALTSSFRKGFLYFISIFTVLCGIGLLIPLYFTFCSAPYIQLQYAAFATIPLYFFLLGLHSIRRYIKKMEITRDRMYLGNGTSYMLKDIRSYALFHQKDKYYSWEELHLFLEDGKSIYFSSLSYKNFDELKKVLIAGKENITSIYLKQNLKKMWMNLGITLALAAGSIYGIVTFAEKVFPARVYTIKDLIEMPGVLSTDPEIYNGQIYLKLTSRPDFDFRLLSGDVDVQTFSKSVHQKDSVFIYILKEDYETKLSSKRKPDFELRHFDFTDVFVYGISDVEYIYSQPDEKWTINSSSPVEENLIFLVVFCFIFSILSIMVYYGYSLKQNTEE